MGQSGRSRHQKRARAQAQLRNLEAYAAQPHSFVFARGRAGRGVRQLSLDLRRVMEPLTATRLQVRKKNSLKDCVAVAGPLGVTHFLILSKTETNIYFKLMRLPGGPTLTFRINKYTLVRDVVSSLRRHRMHEQQFTHAPLLVLNSFGPHGMHVKLMATMFQNLFPSINVHKVNLNTIKRCLLINYNPDSQELDFRHYSIKVVPVGASRGMKKLLQEKFPNMSRLQDISELLATGAGLSESEAEPDGEHNITELPQAVAGRGNMRAQQSAVRLTECTRPRRSYRPSWQPRRRSCGSRPSGRISRPGTSSASGNSERPTGRRAWRASSGHAPMGTVMRRTPGPPPKKRGPASGRRRRRMKPSTFARQWARSLMRTCSRRQPSGDGPLDTQAKSSRENSGGWTEAVTGGN
uniref:Peter pan homolog n=1 Tax=Equus caballus TaxID=9796 RepID=F6SE28_HORSE